MSGGRVARAARAVAVDVGLLRRRRELRLPVDLRPRVDDHVRFWGYDARHGADAHPDLIEAV